MRVVGARGTAFEIGEALGAADPARVRRAIEVICRFDVEPAELEHRRQRVESRLAAAFPHVLEELEGLARGAGVSRESVLSLSVASDLHGRLPGRCSLVSVPTDQGVLVAKNLDTSPELRQLQVVQRIERDGALAFVHVTCAGAMWTDGGVNEAGLALANSSLAATGVDPEGVPDGILAREVLAQCTDVPSAVAFAQRHPVMTLGEALLVADSTGASAVVETLPGGRSIRTGLTLIACNHPLVSGMEPLAAPDDPIRPNSEGRLARLEREVERTLTWTFEGVAQVLGHDEVYQRGNDGLWTVASIVASPMERWLWSTDAPPGTTANWSRTSPASREASRRTT